jgi:intracellular septation protein
MSQNNPTDTNLNEPAKERPGRKLMLDLGPLLLFFVANYLTKDIMLAIQVLVVATLVSLAVSWVTEKRISIMAAIGCLAVVFFGGLSVYFDNDLFIKIKPTIVTCIFAAAIAGGRLIGRNPLGVMMGGQIKLTDTGWQLLSWVWVAMFALMAVANEIAWRTLSTDDWVTFKVFGMTGISLVLTILTVPICAKHMITEEG